MSIVLPNSVLQKGRHSEVSDRYESVDTEMIINSLLKRGFSLHNIQESRVRKQSNQGFQKHMVWMQFDEMKTKEGVPSIVVMNSHNRSSSLKFHTGYIRWACSNQLVGGSDITSLSLRHSDNWKDKAVPFLDSYIDNVEVMNTEHERMKSQHLSASMIREIAHRAAALRYDPRDVMDSMELQLVRRTEDRGDDAYRVYNRIQESLIQGLFQRRMKHVDEDGNVQYSDFSKAAKLTSNDEIVRVNKDIRSLVMEYA